MFLINETSKIEYPSIFVYYFTRTIIVMSIQYRICCDENILLFFKPLVLDTLTRKMKKKIPSVIYVHDFVLSKMALLLCPLKYTIIHNLGFKVVL